MLKFEDVNAKVSVPGASLPLADMSEHSDGSSSIWKSKPKQLFSICFLCDGVLSQYWKSN